MNPDDQLDGCLLIRCLPYGALLLAGFILLYLACWVLWGE